MHHLLDCVTVWHTIIHQFDPDRYVVGGIDGYIRDILRLADPSQTIRLVGVTTPNSNRPLGVWQGARIGRREVPFLPVAVLCAGDQSRRVPHSLTLVKGLYRYRPDTRGGAAHFHRADVAWAGRRALKGAGRTVVFFHSSSEEALQKKVETFRRFAPRLNRFVERRAAAGADLGFVMHTKTAAQFSAINPRVSLGKNWFDDAVFFPPDQLRRQDMPRIVWAGRFEPPKNPLLAVATLSRLQSLGTEFTASFAGAGTLEPEVRRAVASSRLESRVTFHGVLDETELAELLRASDVFLLTSLWEGIPRGVIEALATGLPVVATDCGDVKQLLPPSAGAVVAGEERDLADAVGETLQRELDAASIAASVSHLRGSNLVPRLLATIEGDVSDASH